MGRWTCHSLLLHPEWPNCDSFQNRMKTLETKDTFDFAMDNIVGRFGYCEDIAESVSPLVLSFRIVAIEARGNRNKRSTA